MKALGVRYSSRISEMKLRSTLVSALRMIGVLSVTLISSASSLAMPATIKTSDANGQVNVRSGPGTRHPIIDRTPTGTTIEAINLQSKPDQDSWVFVRFPNGREGWVSGDFVRYTELVGYGTLVPQNPGDQVNVREQPSSSSKRLHYGISGDLVNVLRSQTGRDAKQWHYVKFPSGATGWVRGDLVRLWASGN
jgi:uncharacterized protein YraI